MAKPQKFDWGKSVGINLFVLKITGLWPESDHGYELNFYSLCATISLAGLLCLHTFVQTFNIYFILDDLEAFTSTIFVTLSCIGAVAKAFCLIYNMKSVKQLFADLQDEMFQPKNEEQVKLVAPSIKLWRYLYWAFTAGCTYTPVLWGSYPILDNETDERKFPFLAWYPYESKVSPYYEITYAHQVVSIYYLVFISMNVDCLIAALNMIVATQCDLLVDNLKKIKGDRINEELIRCIRHHKAVLRFSENSNDFFNWIILMQFFTSTVSVGFSLFELTLIKPFSLQFYSFLCYGTGITLEMFIYCWFGNEVEVKSDAISYAAFESDWIGSSLSFQRNLLIFTLRTQKPIKLSAFKFFYLSLETFKAILRTSWSYFALLNQVNSEL